MKTYIEYRNNDYFCHFLNEGGLPTPEIKLDQKGIKTLIKDLRLYKGKRKYTAVHYVEDDELIESSLGDIGEVEKIDAEDNGVIIVTERIYRKDGEIGTSIHRMKIRRLVIEVEND